MVQAVTLAFSVLALVPAAILFFAAYGRYDGAFRDTVVFMFFIGGLLAGGFLGFVSLFVFNALAELIAVLGIALLFPIVLVASINRRKWQGDRHSVFNGGALGLGAAVMVALSLLYFDSVTLERRACAALVAGYDPSEPFGSYAIRRFLGAEHGLSCGAPLSTAQRTFVEVFTRDHAFSVATLAQAILLAAGLAGLMFALGLLAGDAVRQRRQFRGALVGTAVILAPAIFLGELVLTWNLGSGGEWLWCLLLAAYGGIVAALTERKLLPLGLGDDAKKARRRKRRERFESRE